MTEQKKRRSTKRDYVNGPDLHEALIQYLNKVKEAEAEGTSIPIIPRYIGESIILINTKLATKYNFTNYSLSWKEEMVLQGIENCVRAVPNYNPDYIPRNPFGYFSRIAWNSFIYRIKFEKKEQYIKHKNMQMVFTESELMGITGATESDENSNRVISEFEDKLKAAKTKKAKKKSSKPKGVEVFTQDE